MLFCTFWATTENGIFDMVLKGQYDLEQDPWGAISAGAKDLIAKMLVQDPEEENLAGGCVESSVVDWWRSGQEVGQRDRETIKIVRGDYQV